jgi:hypothetical protein
MEGTSYAVKKKKTGIETKIQPKKYFVPKVKCPSLLNDPNQTYVA